MKRNGDFTKSFVRRPGQRDDTSIPIRTEAPPPLRQPTRVARSKTLTRPERGQPQVPLINPSTSGFSSASKGREGSAIWRYASLCVTFWAPSAALSACAGLKDRASRQAWREKVTLVFIALLLGAFIGYITMGLNATLCPTADSISASTLVRVGGGGSTVGVDGWEFDIASARNLPSEDDLDTKLFSQARAESGLDVTPLFKRAMASNYPACQGLSGAYALNSVCTTLDGTRVVDCPLGDMVASSYTRYGMRNTTRRIGYSWEDIESGRFKNFIVLDGTVLNMNPYLDANPRPISGDKVDAAIRSALGGTFDGGRDTTMSFYTHADTRGAIRCLTQKYRAGRIDKITPGCFISNLVLYISLVIILGIVLIRFLMALWFSWFMAGKMAKAPKDNGRRKIMPNMMPDGAMMNVNSSGAAPWANKQPPPPRPKPSRMRHDSSFSSTPSVPETLSIESIGSEPYVVCLVTCYSENEEGISTTLTSLAETDYSDSRKLIFVVADGMVTGSGETVSTPDVCVSLLDADPRFGTPIPMSFISVAQGKKQHNMAMVYAGHYTRARGHRTPMVVVVKCGTPEEASGAKPGNRGKRDSQMILMNFFQRVTYNDRMTPLDYDLFRKIHTLMGVTPDFFELCLMVDADTMVYPQSMSVLANVMMQDHLVMGACGETRIANKTASWVTAIQVYEYFISHHQAKAFESVFGGVTCLPGCFSMYRIKARKISDDDWVPIIVKPEVTREYSQSTVGTLHQKNLLLLGEDRFLTTLLLRTFPNRKMVFCPKARCRTEVPHTFKMLLSQRRRWINSTVHNLMELVLVRDLCGTFCFSMQFVVFMDLLGTAVLPVAIALTYTLVVKYCLDPPNSFTEAIPLMLLIAVIGLPGLLILLATRKVVYVLWMLVYLVALPIWNFVLPVYSFWHFDDFSWGETRKVEGEGKDVGHIHADGVFSQSSVPLRRWEDWERSRLRKQKREEKRRRELEKQFGQGFYNDSDGDHDRKEPGMPPTLRPESDSFSDTISDVDEDRWGEQIGGYDETAPPPLAIVRHSVWVGGEEVVLDQKSMEAVLEKGWEDGGVMRSAITNTGQPQRPSAVTKNRFSMIEEAVPKIPARFSHLPPFRPEEMEMQRTTNANGGEYASLMRGSSQPPSPAYPPRDDYAPGPGAGPGPGPIGHSSAVSGHTQTHARNRSGGAGQQLNGGGQPPYGRPGPGPGGYGNGQPRF